MQFAQQGKELAAHNLGDSPFGKSDQQRLKTTSELSAHGMHVAQ
jgi:hypothetical protein